MVEITIPTALKSLSMAGGASKALAAWRKKATGDNRALLNELENNLRYLDLVAEDDVSLADIVGDLQISEFDMLLAEGYNFNALKRKKIDTMPSLKATDLKAWQGKETQELLFSIYEKIKDVRVKYPHTSNSTRYRWSVRVQNIRKRIWLLAKHLNS